MILIQPGNPVFLSEQPFAGGLGASLYAAIDDGRGAAAIEYRPHQLSGPPTLYSGPVDLRKTKRLADVDQPTAELRFEIPAAWLGQTVWVNPRTHAQDFENRTLFRPRQIHISAEGTVDTPVLGKATILAIEKRDGGGVRVRFSYQQPRDGRVPNQFVLAKVTGSGTIMPGTVAYGASQRVYEIDLTGLSHGVAYTFTLWAETPSGSTELVTGIAFTGDSQGPPAVTASYEEW